MFYNTATNPFVSLSHEYVIQSSKELETSPITMCARHTNIYVKLFLLGVTPVPLILFIIIETIVRWVESNILLMISVDFLMLTGTPECSNVLLSKLCCQLKMLLPFSLQNLTTLRTVVLCASAVVIVLPLAMLRDISNLSSISIASLSFYTCFLFYVSEYITSLVVMEPYYKDNKFQIKFII